MTTEEKIKELKAKMKTMHSEWAWEEIETALQEAITYGREGTGGYIVTEIHRECGKTTNGQKLYWAKVRKSLTP